MGADQFAREWARTGRAQASSLYLFAYYLGSSVVGSVGGLFWNQGA
ncbi:MAG: hypothetical protein J2P47_08890 [Acetobacteraceae bacterium]|nr:hypothetical protein [Acetobacteraceae bacterium]